MEQETKSNLESQCVGWREKKFMVARGLNNVISSHLFNTAESRNFTEVALSFCYISIPLPHSFRFSKFNLDHILVQYTLSFILYIFRSIPVHQNYREVKRCVVKKNEEIDIDKNVMGRKKYVLGSEVRMIFIYKLILNIKEEIKVNIGVCLVARKRPKPCTQVDFGRMASCTLQ
jgi:hypothetical protein